MEGPLDTVFYLSIINFLLKLKVSLGSLLFAELIGGGGGDFPSLFRTGPSANYRI